MLKLTSDFRFETPTVPGMSAVVIGPDLNVSDTAGDNDIQFAIDEEIFVNIANVIADDLNDIYYGKNMTVEQVVSSRRMVAFLSALLNHFAVAGIICSVQ